jgi:hypothetical protein
MAVREFLDQTGRLWRAWDIKPESIHPPTRAEDWLADCYVTGWIVFETISGDEKRRLCPWPMRWAEASDVELRELLAQAILVPPQRNAEQNVDSAVAPQDAAVEDIINHAELDVTDLEVVRTFRYPGGRFWTVCVMSSLDDGTPPVLRFTSGMRSIDLRKWPKNWADQPDDVLVLMLRYAAPRRGSQASNGSPRRRWDDLQQTV